MMIMNHSEMPLDSLVGELFERASRKPRWVAVGWLLAIGSHAAAALLFVNHQKAAAPERSLPPVEVEFVVPPEPAPAPAPEPAAPEAVKVAPTHAAAPAPASAARAGALHLAKADVAPAQQQEEAVDFTTDAHGASYGGGVVAVGGTAAFAAAGARVVPAPGSAPAAPPSARPGEALTPPSDLSRKPRLPVSDPCHGFFPSAAQDDVGDVGVMVTIGKSGRVSQTRLVSESPAGQGFGAAARICLASQAFVPALDRAGNAAATAIRVNLRFSR
jgi:outer membrane biosynthesis protein TonB